MNHTSFIDLELEDAWQWEPELSLDANPLMEEWPSFDKNVWEEAACSWGVSNMQVGETTEGLLGGDLGLEQGLGSSESLFMTVDGEEGMKNLLDGPAAKQAKQEPPYSLNEDGDADRQSIPALALNSIPPEAKPPAGPSAPLQSQAKSHPRRARSNLAGRLRGRAAVVKGAVWKGGPEDAEKPRKNGRKKVSSRHSSPRPAALSVRAPIEDMKAGAEPGSPQSPLQSWPSMGAMTAEQKGGEVYSSVLDPALDRLARKRAKAAEKSMRHRRKKKAAEAEAAERARKQEDTIRKLRALLAEAGEENASLKRRNEELQQEVARLRTGFS